MSCQINHNRDIEDLILTNNNDNLENDYYYLTVKTLFDIIINLSSKGTEYKIIKKEFHKHFNRFGRKNIPFNKILLIKAYRKLIENGNLPDNELFWSLLRKKPKCTLSGIISFAVLLSPTPTYIDLDGKTKTQEFTCKHNCYYCPDEPGTPRSYLKGDGKDIPGEPAVARGLHANWDPIIQIENRFISLENQGHKIDKIEFIIEGGTFTEFPVLYLKSFIRDIYYAVNTYNYIKREKGSLAEEMNINRNSKIKIIGVCCETRPDAIFSNDNPNNDPYFWIKFFRECGITRVQLGVQHTDSTILKKANRGHTYKDAETAAILLIQNGFKVDGHFMPDLPYSTPEKDKNMLRQVIDCGLWDAFKLYPYVAVPYSVYQKQLMNDKFQLYSNNDPNALSEVLEFAFENFKYWQRCARMYRDIPTQYISHGLDIPNVRDITEKNVVAGGCIIKEMRYREIGRQSEYFNKPKRYFIEWYESQAGLNYFISLESYDRKALFGFIRLLVPTKIELHNVFPINKNKAKIRELHVYGILSTVHDKNTNSNGITVQNNGVGKNLITICEYLAWYHNCEGITVISGEGVRNYYSKFGYKDADTFMNKTFNISLITLVIIVMEILLLCLHLKLTPIVILFNTYILLYNNNLKTKNYLHM